MNPAISLTSNESSNSGASVCILASSLASKDPSDMARCPIGDLTREDPFRMEALRLDELRMVAMELALEAGEGTMVEGGGRSRASGL